MLTADTHFPNGYVDDNCDTKYEDNYANSISCASLKAYNFINWIQEQDFYDNTTIVIVGDHLTMDSTDFIKKFNINIPRTVYNVFINSVVEEKNNKNRSFTVMDLYPTTLAAMGVKFNNDRLGLGTNLFSDTKTLFEELGGEYLNNELVKTSTFYNYYIVGNSYVEMQTKKE